jgi:hypothetical protein
VPVTLIDPKFFELLSHLFQAHLFTLIHRLIKSVPMQDPHAKNHLESKPALRRFAQRIIKGLNVVVGSALLFRHDPLGDLAQILERTVAMLASREYLVRVRVVSVSTVDL